jgi:hypothetical protein
MNALFWVEMAPQHGLESRRSAGLRLLAYPSFHIITVSAIVSASCMTLDYINPVRHFISSKLKGPIFRLGLNKLAPQHGLEPRTRWLIPLTAGLCQLISQVTADASLLDLSFENNSFTFV